MQESQAADQVMRASIQASEAAARLAALGAKNLAALCLALAKENSQLKGESSLNKLLKSGSALKVFDLQQNDLPAFKEQAKRYGVLYSVIKDSLSAEGRVDLIVRAEDIARINHILEQIGYALPKQGQDNERGQNNKQAPAPSVALDKSAATAKKPLSRAPSNTKSPEHGNGSKPKAADTLMSKGKSNKVSVREQIAYFKAMLAQKKPDKNPQKQRDRPER